MPEHATTQSRIAGLADSDGDAHVISGIAIGDGDVTRGLSGDQKVWRGEQLARAASTLVGVPVFALHSDAVVGEVTDAAYEPGTGVVYEAALEDSTLAQRVAQGGLEVSVEARHADGGTVETPQGEAMLATDIQFDGLAILQRGAAPSASAEAGEAAALAPADIRAALHDSALAEVNGEEVDLSPPERVVNAAQAALDAKAKYDTLADCGTGVGEARAEQIVNGDLAPADFINGGEVSDTAIPTYLDSHSEDAPDTDAPPTEWGEEEWTDGCGPVQLALWGYYLDWAAGVEEEIRAAMDDEQNAAEMRTVAGVSFRGTREGELDESAIPNDDYESHYLYPGETKSESSYPVVDADGFLRRGNVDAAWQLGARGNADEDDHDERLLRLADEFDNPPEWAQTEANAMSAAFDVGDRVAWDWSGGTANGRVAEVITGEGTVTRTFDGTEVTRDSDEEPVYVLDVWRGDEYAGGALKSESELEAWSDPPEAAQAAKHMAEADLREVPDEYVFKNPNAATGKAEEMGLDDGEIHQHPPKGEVNDGDDVVFMPGSSHESLMTHLREEGLLGDTADGAGAAAASDDPAGASSPGADDATNDQTTTPPSTHMTDDPDNPDEPTVEELRARLSEKEDRIAALEQQVEQYEQERADVARAYAEALTAEDSVFTPEDLAERFEVAELRERVNEREDATLADVAEPDVQSGDTGEQTEMASLSEADREAAEEHRAALRDLADSDRPLAEHERERRAAKLAEITGEDPDTILEQEA